MPEVPAQSRSDRLLPWLGLAAAAAMLFAHLDAGSLLGSDDAIYAAVARDALRTGAWWDFSWHGRPWFEKGPLLTWLLMASQALLGDSEAALRLPGVLFGLGLVAGCYRLARRLGIGVRPSLAAAGLALASNVLYFNARRPMTDVPGASLALAGFVLVAFGDGRARPLIGGACLGLASLAKVVSPVPFVIALVLLQADPRLRRPRAIALAALTAVAVSVPWHVAMTVAHGAAFWQVYVGFNLVTRAAAVVAGPAAGSAYIGWLAERDPASALASIGALVVMLPAAVRGAIDARCAWILAACAGIPLALAATGLPHYLVPLVPGVALAFGSALNRLPDTTLGQAGLVAIFATLACAFVVQDGRDLTDPDYGPGAKAACAEVASAGLHDRLAATFELHDPAIDWYCDAALPLWSADATFTDAMERIPMLSGSVVAVDVPRLASRAASRPVVVTRPDRLDRLRSIAAQGGMVLREIPAKSRVVVEVSRGR